MSPKTHKTPAVMKLLTGSPKVENPILDESFKQEIIRSQKNPVPVKKVTQNDGSTAINISSEIISQWLPTVIKRFNLCKCDRCSAEMTVEAFDRIDPIIVKVKTDADVKKAQKIKGEREQEVLMKLVRIAIERRRFEKHEG